MTTSRAAHTVTLLCLVCAGCGDEGGITEVRNGDGSNNGGGGDGPLGPQSRKPLKCVTETRDTSNSRLIALKFDYFDRSVRLVRTERDLDADGKLEQVQAWTYGSNGRIEEELYDSDADGEPEETWQYRYRPDNLLAESRGDTDGDAEVDTLHRYVYRTTGTLQHRDEDWDADGVNDARTAYRFDERGNLTLIEVDINVDSVADARIENTYNAQDRITEITADWNADGLIEQREVFTYTPNTITQERDLDGDGRFDEIWVRRHRDDGRITAVEADLDADGTPDRRMTFDYECFELDSATE